MAWPCSSDRFGPYDIQAHLSSAFQGDELKKQVALVKAIAEFLLDSQIPAFVSNIVRIIYAGHLIKTLLNSIAACLVT